MSILFGPSKFIDKIWNKDRIFFHIHSFFWIFFRFSAIFKRNFFINSPALLQAVVSAFYIFSCMFWFSFKKCIKIDSFLRIRYNNFNIVYNLYKSFVRHLLLSVNLGQNFDQFARLVSTRRKLWCIPTRLSNIPNTTLISAKTKTRSQKNAFRNTMSIAD